VKIATRANPALRGDQPEVVGRLDANPDEARWLGSAAVLCCCTGMKKAGSEDRNRPLTCGEVFTFRPELGKRGLGGGAPTG
jgi:hypothetical protein